MEKTKKCCDTCMKKKDMVNQQGWDYYCHVIEDRIKGDEAKHRVCDEWGDKKSSVNFRQA